MSAFHEINGITLNIRQIESITPVESTIGEHPAYYFYINMMSGRSIRITTPVLGGDGRAEYEIVLKKYQDICKAWKDND